MTAAVLTIDTLNVRVPVGTWTIDPAHSSIGFSVRHLMGKVRGTFEEFTGHVTITEEPTDCSATATISMRSVNTANRMRDDDLRSVNFFDVDRHPDMTFESTGLTVHDGLLELSGKLTIRSITRDVVMEVEFLGLDETGLQGEQRIGISATTTIRRSDYDVGAGTGEGQKIVVGDKITIQLDIQAMLES
jgi:polyisoprenoid-binding protein YceI